MRERKKRGQIRNGGDGERGGEGWWGGGVDEWIEKVGRMIKRDKKGDGTENN